MIGGRPYLAVGCSVATIALLMARSAAAASITTPSAGPASPVLDYVAERDCPGRDRFVAQVEEALDPSERSRVRGARGTKIRVEIQSLKRMRRQLVEELGATMDRYQRMLAAEAEADGA